MQQPPDNSLTDQATPRILIVRVGAMGDVLHAMPAVAALRTALPNAVIAWAIEPRWAPLLSTTGAIPRSPEMPLVDRVHLVEARAWSRSPLSLATARSIAALRRDLRAQHYDIAIDLQGTIRSSIIARMSGAKRVFGNAAPRETVARWLYTERVAVTTKHVVEQATELVSQATNVQLKPASAPLPVDVEADRWCESVLPGDKRTIFIAPTAGWGAKQWPANRFGFLARALADRGYSVLINAAPTGVDAVTQAVLQASSGAATIVPCTLPQLIALLRRTTLVIAGDSGPLHLAAALDKPVVALFGPTDPARNGPWATPSRILRNAASVTDHHRHAVIEAGLARITADEVLQAALDLLQSTEARTHR